MNPTKSKACEFGQCFGSSHKAELHLIKKFGFLISNLNIIYPSSALTDQSGVMYAKSRNITLPAITEKLREPI